MTDFSKSANLQWPWYAGGISVEAVVDLLQGFNLSEVRPTDFISFLTN